VFHGSSNTWTSEAKAEWDRVDIPVTLSLVPTMRLGRVRLEAILGVGVDFPRLDERYDPASRLFESSSTSWRDYMAHAGAGLTFSAP
jgi:hypothetical protein